MKVKTWRPSASRRVRRLPFWPRSNSPKSPDATPCTHHHIRVTASTITYEPAPASTIMYESVEMSCTKVCRRNSLRPPSYKSQPLHPPSYMSQPLHPSSFTSHCIHHHIRARQDHHIRVNASTIVYESVETLCTKVFRRTPLRSPSDTSEPRQHTPKPPDVVQILARNPVTKSSPNKTPDFGIQSKHNRRFSPIGNRCRDRV